LKGAKIIPKYNHPFYLDIVSERKEAIKEREEDLEDYFSGII